MNTFNPSSLFKATAVAAMLVCGSAHAQFITGSDSTFSGTTPGSQNNDTTVNGTNWQTTNPLGVVDIDYLIGGTGDGLAYTPNGPSATSGDNYLGLAQGHSAATLLVPNSFTGVGGATDYTYDINFQVQGFRSSVLLNTFTGYTAQSFIWSVGRANSYANALAGNFTSLLGTGNGTTDNVAGWQSINGQFTTLGGGPYTDVYFVFANNSAISIPTNYVAIDNVTAVPEPETYAMMLAGLGALGFMSRRRKQG